MSEKESLALQHFSNGYNCAQSVLAVFAEDLNLNKDTAMKLAGPFGAGMVYQQETCGAVTGALMAIGLKFGKGINGTIDDKEKAYDMSRYFLNEFKKKHEFLHCKELLSGIDMTTPEGLQKLQEMDAFKLRCTNFVSDAVTLVNKIITHK